MAVPDVTCYALYSFRPEISVGRLFPGGGYFVTLYWDSHLFRFAEQEVLHADLRE